MLFQKLYNWIKYKNTPTSFLQKNRLFLERDSKNKRIFPNFGLHFRNSKWSSYSTFNIKTQFILNYFNIFLFFFLLFLLLFFYKYFAKYYIRFSILNNIFFFLWIGIETWHYLILFIFWFFLVALTSIFKIIYFLFFFNKFNFEFNKVLLDSKLNSKLLTSLNIKKLNQSNDNRKLVYFAWLKNTHSSLNYLNVKNLYLNNTKNFVLSDYFKFFIELFKLNYFLNFNANGQNFRRTTYNANNSINSLNKILQYINNAKQISNQFTILTLFKISTFEEYFDFKNKQSSSLKFLNNNHKWNIQVIDDELRTSDFAKKIKVGNFYFINLNYEKLLNYSINYFEALNITVQVQKQLNVSKWNRWLYRYSVTHRKNIKNSHQITNFKTLINSGNYDSNFFNKNLWNSENFSLYKTNASFSSLNKIFYKNIFTKETLPQVNLKKSLIINNFSNTTSLNLLNIHENSFFWFVKRFYQFNSLSTNAIKSSTLLTDHKSMPDFTLKTDSENFKNKVIYSYFLKLQNNNLSNFFNNYNTAFKWKNNLKSYEVNNYDVSFFNDKDIFIQFNDNEIFTKDNLISLSWIISSSESKNKLVTFSYFNKINSPTFKKKKVFIKTIKQDKNLINLNYLSHVNSYNSFKQDLLLFVNSFKN